MVHDRLSGQKVYIVLSSLVKKIMSLNTQSKISRERGCRLRGVAHFSQKRRY